MENVFDCAVATITVTPEVVTIQHKKGTYHGRKTKDIRIKSISGIELREPGLVMAGYIQFIFSGGKEAGDRSRLDAAKNENTVMIRKKDYDKFLECKNLVDKYISEAHNSSSKPTTTDADELKKWVELKESGAITEEEYESKKKQILGL